MIFLVEGDRALLLAPKGDVAHSWQTGGGVTKWLFRAGRYASDTPETKALGV